MSLKVLLLCNRVPFPAKDGGAIAMLQMIKGLTNAGCIVDVFSLNTSRNYVNIETIPEDFKLKHRFISVDIDTNIYPHKAFLNLFSKKSYNTSRFISDKVNKQLVSVLKTNTYDLIQLEGLFVSPYIQLIRSNSNAKIALRTHNVESEIWFKLAQNSVGLKKWYYKILAKRLLEYETKVIQEIDFLIPITMDDLERFKQIGYRGNYFISPTGFTFKNSNVTTSNVITRTVFHLGSMDWRPNIESMNWFIQNVWPEVQKKHPDSIFHLAGKNTPSSFYALNDSSIKVHGEIESASDFMNNYAIMVVPLFSGSGMRIKIIEGMALGKTIITTSLGAEGINVKHQNDILIANNAQEFIDLLDKCLSNLAASKRIGDNAKKNTLKYYDNDLIVSGLVNYYKQKL